MKNTKLTYRGIFYTDAFTRVLAACGIAPGDMDAAREFLIAIGDGWLEDATRIVESSPPELKDQIIAAGAVTDEIFGQVADAWEKRDNAGKTDH